MKYRTLGRTGLSVSEIGMGCEGFAGKSDAEIAAFLDALEQGGINCIDLYISDPALRSSLGRALAGRRGAFILQAHLCSVWRDGQYKRSREIGEVREGFADLLARLDTEHVEIGMLHYVDALSDWERIVNGPVIEYALSLKRAGVIGCIGMSSHNPGAARAAVRSGLIDVLMFSVNPCYDLQPGGENVDALWDDKSYERPLVNMDPARQALYEECQNAGVGITVMKAFGGGDLLDAALSPAGMALTANQCLHYALTRPAVASVLCGARTLADLAQSLAYETASDAEKDFASAFAKLPKISWRGRCMYCGHCAPCPQGIDVAAVTKFLHLARAQREMPETVREHYALLAHKAGECLACGACEARCPFEVKVRDNMAAAKALFGA